MKHAPAADRNKGPILEQLKTLLPGKHKVLEVGSYGGQHAIHFAMNLPGLTWQPGDTEENLADLQQAIAGANLPNLKEPLLLDANHDAWPVKEKYDVLYTANTMHIMTEKEVEKFFQHLPAVLREEGMVILYGPFRFDGKFTSESNQRFHEMLESRNLGQGIRDFERLAGLAKKHLGFMLAKRIDLPANNQLLVFS